MTDSAQIVGIMLVQNEERYVGRALGNALDFCDRMLVADHQSTDDTWSVLARAAAGDPRIELRRVRDPSETHDMISVFAGTPTWIFGVDGDEIYDPGALAGFRARVLGGEFDRAWQIFGNVLNCVILDEAKAQASGYLAPPSRSMTKLFNFNAIDSWGGPVAERLHGGEIAFREGFGPDCREFLLNRYAWEHSPFRCLHLCFLPRSRRDSTARPRRNIMELVARGRWGRLVDRLGLGQAGSDYKKEKYRRGELVSKPVNEFLVVPSDHPA